MFRKSFIIMLICSSISLSYAQDSLKKPAAVKAYPTTYNKYHVYKYHSKADSAAAAAAREKARQAITSKTDSIAPAPVVIDKSLNGQYQYLLTKVYHYQAPLISVLWKSASDTLANNRKKLKAAQATLDLQSKTIDSLKSKITDQALLASRVDGINIMGIMLSKTTYNLIVWGLVAIFGITAIVVIARSASFRHEAKEKTLLYSELEEEFKAFKTKANDKEKKLARELQTERNKLDELLGR